MIVQIKGYNSNLELIFNENSDFPSILEELTKVFSSSTNFFAPLTNFKISKNRFTKIEQETLEILFDKFQYKIEWEIFDSLNENSSENKKKINKHDSTAEIDSKHLSNIEKLPIREFFHNLRNGEEILYPGSLIIHGNVNPGATVKAYGFIDIRGNCRGLVHAGANGDEAAYIISDNLSPLQIRIASYVACSPDSTSNNNHKCQIARVVNSTIVIEKYER